MPRFGRNVKIGRSASPTDEIPNIRAHGGRSLDLGDGITDDQTAGANSATESIVGWRAVAGPGYYRTHAFVQQPLDPGRIAGAEIVSSRIFVPFSNVVWASFSGSFEINVFLVRAAINIADVDWDEADAAGNVFFNKPGMTAGVDYDSAAVGVIPIDIEFCNAVDAGSPTAPHMAAVNVVTAMREAAENGWDTITFVLIAAWSSGTNRYFFLQRSQDFPTNEHGYVDIDYLPALSWFAQNADGSINYGAFLDHEISDRDARVLTGNPPPGGTGPTKSAALANAGTNDLSEIYVISVQAFGEAPSRPAGRRFPRFAKVHNDVGSTEGYLDGSTRMVPMPSFETTRYQAYFTPAFGVEDASPLETVLGEVYGRYDRDETFLYDGKEAFTILEEKWGLAPAAVVGDEVWTFKHLKEALPSGYTLEAAEAHEMTQHQGLHEAGVFDRELADPDKWRDVWNATVQQCSRASRVASFTSDLGTFDRTHLAVGEVNEYVIGQPATVQDGTNVEHFIIDGKIAGSDPTNPDELIADRELVHSYGSDAKVSTALFIGDLAARKRSSIGVAALAGQGFVVLDLPLPVAAGTVKIYRLSNGTTEVHAFSQSGSTLSFTDASVVGAGGFAVGDLVTVVEETSWCPVFFRLRPEQGAAEVQNLSLVRAMRFNTK